MTVPIRGKTLMHTLRIAARDVSGLLVLGVGVIILLLGVEPVEECYERANEVRLRQEKFISGLFAASLDQSNNLQIVGKLPVAFSIVLVKFGIMSWWRPFMRLGVAMVLTSLCMLLMMYASLKVWPMKKGFLFGHDDVLRTAAILAVGAGAMAGGLLIVGFSRWTSVDDGTP